MKVCVESPLCRIASSCWQAQSACAKASAFKQNHIVPHVIDVTIPLPSSYFAKTAFFVKSAAGVVVCNDLRLQCPIPFPLGVCDQPIEQRVTGALLANIPTYVDADLSDPGSASCIRNRSES